MNKRSTNITKGAKKATVRVTKKITSSTVKKKSVLSKKRTTTLTHRIIHYVLPLGNGWVVKNSAANNFTFITDSKKEAVSMARSIAQVKHSELVVHRKNGSIEVKESYAQ